MFAGNPYAPFYCLAAEFFEAARARLSPNGLLALNVYAPGGDRTLAGAVVGTLATVFPTVLEVPAPEASVLIAFREPTPPDTVRARLDGPDLPGELAPVAGRVAAALSTTALGRGIVLTDDHAPVEPLTHEMILRQDRLRAAPGRN